MNKRSLLSLLSSRLVVADSLWPHRLQHTRCPCPLPSPGVCSNSCPLSQWCHSTISSSVVAFPPALNLSQHQGLFQWVSSLHQVAKYWSFSFSISILSMNIQGWFPLRLTSLILQSKWLSRVFSSTTVGKHQFFSAQPSLRSSSHIHTRLLEKP